MVRLFSNLFKIPKKNTSTFISKVLLVAGLSTFVGCAQENLYENKRLSKDGVLDGQQSTSVGSANVLKRPSNYGSLKRVTLWYEVDHNSKKELTLSPRNEKFSLAPGDELDPNVIEPDSEVDILSLPESGKLVVVNENEGTYRYTPAKDFDGIDQIETLITTPKGEQIIGVVKLLIKVTVFNDSFEREVVIDESTRDAFSWASLVEDGENFSEQHLSAMEVEKSPFENGSNVDACFNGICAQILSSEDGAKNNEKSESFGPVADGEKALFFWGRKGHSIHSLNLLSKSFDLSEATHARFSFSSLIMDLGDLSKPEKSLNDAGEGEFFKVQICVDTLEACGIFDNFQYSLKDMRDSSVWHTLYEPVDEYGDSDPKLAEGNGLNGRNHTGSDWHQEKVHLVLEKLKNQFPNFDQSNVVFRFHTRIQDGFDQKGNLGSRIEDAVALDNVELITYSSTSEDGLEQVFGDELEQILGSSRQQQP